MKGRFISAVAIALDAQRVRGTDCRRATRGPCRRTIGRTVGRPGANPRDLFWGVGRPEARAAAGRGILRFDAKDDAGFSVSYDVTSPDGMEWSAKIGPEAQTEVVVSRILWGLGYHQPPVYYLPRWTARHTGATTSRTESEARFRPEAGRTSIGSTNSGSWADNPFAGTRELPRAARRPADAEQHRPQGRQQQHLRAGGRRSAVRAAGSWSATWAPRSARPASCIRAATGSTASNASGFITGVSGGRVEFDYDGRHADLLAMHHSRRRALGGAADAATQRRPMARCLPLRQLRGTNRHALHPPHRAEDR